MKTTPILLLTALTLFSCEKVSLQEQEQEQQQIDNTPTKKFTFTIKGDFGAATFTRGTMQADGKDMTDLWVLDYVDGNLVQQLHQTSEDANFGTPSMPLAYGSHHIYFVASRGGEPSINTTDNILTWDIVRDTFWKDYEVNVVSTSNGNRAVTLDRVATKLRININDEVPANIATVTVTPTKWYYGINYTTGAPVSAQQKPVTLEVPSTYIGTTDQLYINLYGISEPNEWTTNISVTAADNTNVTIGSATITGAPFKRNRATEYSGNLFASSGNLNVSIASSWESPQQGTW